MASRFAVTTGNWTGAIWAATSGGAAGSAAVPTSADDVTINKNVTVTIDDTSAVALSVVLSTGTTGSDVGGILTCSTTANSKLLVQKGINVSGSSSGTSGSYSATLTLDMSSASAYLAEILINNAAGTASADTSVILSGRFTLKGYARKRWTVTTGALTGNSSTSVVVADATGWAVGDRLCFISTQTYNATPRTDIVTIATITPGSGTTATVTWSDGTGTGGAVAYDHATGCIVGNFTSNLRIGAATAANRSQCYMGGTAIQNGSSICDHVLFDGMNPADSFRGSFGCFLAAGTGLTSFQSNAFYDFSGSGQSFNQLTALTGTRSNNIFYTTRASAIAIGGTNAGAAETGDDEDFVIFRCATGIQTASSGCDFIDGFISGCTSSADQTTSAKRTFTRCEFFGNNVVRTVSNSASAIAIYDSCGIGDYYSGATNSKLVDYLGPASFLISDSTADLTGTTLTSGLTSAGTDTYLQFLNKNVDAGVQEIYRNTSASAPVLSRDSTVYTRSTSSLLVDFIGTGNVAQSWTASVPAKSGQALTLLLYVRKNSSYGASTLPYASLTGLGITPVTATMSGGTAADDWELLTLSYASGAAPSADGNLTLTLTAQSSTNGAKAYFSGVPLAPFVTRCRHYGYLFDETTPTRTVDVTISASFSTADAYTGMSITWGSSSSIAITTSQTFQKVVDYTSAKAIANVGSALPLTWAGAAGNPALFAAGDVTISDGAVLNGSGSISMSSYTLSTEFSSGSNYTYTGGTWSQPSTVPTFSGGTVNIGTTGTYVFDTVGNTIISMTPAGAGTYSMSGVTATGTLDLRNTAAHAITVELESGISYTTASNTGGTITVSTPQVYQSVVVTGLVVGTRVQIYDTTSTTELANATSTGGDIVFSGGGTVATWTDPTPASASRAIRLRLAYVSGATAKTFVEANIGTCGTTAGTETVSYLANQVNDTVYNDNGIDGPAIYATSGITFVDSGSNDRVICDISSGSVTHPTIYACFVYWMSTSTGIADDITYIDSPDTANYIYTNMKIKNSTSPVVPLSVTGGWGRDVTTGLSITLWDSTGGAVGFSADHAIPYASGSGVTSQDKIDIASEVLSAASSAPIHANIKKVADTTVNGSGTEASPWGP